MTTFVSVGNMTQPFERLLAAVRDVGAALPGPIVVQRGHTPFECEAMEVVDFLPMPRFEALVREASVVVMHAGAGSIIHAIAAGRRPIVMPRRRALGEAIDDHQSELAEALAGEGRVCVVHDGATLREALARKGDRIEPAMREVPPLVRRIAELLDAIDAPR